MPSIFSFSLPDNHPMISILSNMKNRSTYIRRAISNDARWRQQYQTSLRIYSWLKRKSETYGEACPPFEWFQIGLDELGDDTEDGTSE
jgi:hypothetical protein